MDGHAVSPFDLSRNLLVGGGLLVPCSLPVSPVIKQLMQVVYYGAWPGWAVSISVLPLTLAGGFLTISTTWKALRLLISINLTLLHPYFTSSLTPSRPPVHWPFLLPISHFPSCCSIAQLCLTLCDPMNCSMAGFSVLHCLTKFAISLASLFLSKPNLKPMIQLYSTPSLCKYA